MIEGKVENERTEKLISNHFDRRARMGRTLLPGFPRHSGHLRDHLNGALRAERARVKILFLSHFTWGGGNKCPNDEERGSLGTKPLYAKELEYLSLAEPLPRYFGRKDHHHHCPFLF